MAIDMAADFRARLGGIDGDIGHRGRRLGVRGKNMNRQRQQQRRAKYLLEHCPTCLFVREC
jgi:hypothetical protein